MRSQHRLHRYAAGRGHHRSAWQAAVQRSGRKPELKTPTHTLDAVTDDAGEYQFTNLLPGSSTLKATVQGFEIASQIITIRAGEALVENISLEVAEVTAAVTATSSTSGQGVQTTETAPASTLRNDSVMTRR
jgi:hypothetical protein